jgi:hypothetical protein
MTAPRTVRGDIGRADSKELAMQQVHIDKRIALIIPAGVLFLSATANAVIVLGNNDTVNLGALMAT